MHGYDEVARAAGVMVMPGVGFVVTATDCLAAHVAAQMPDASYLRLALSHTGLVSRGSYTTMIGLLREGVTVRRDGRLCAVPAGQLERGFDYGDGERLSTAASWADVFTAYCTTGIPNIEVYVEAGAWARSFYQLTAYFARAAAIGAGSEIAGASGSVHARRPIRGTARGGAAGDRGGGGRSIQALRGLAVAYAGWLQFYGSLRSGNRGDRRRRPHRLSATVAEDPTCGRRTVWLAQRR